MDVIASVSRRNTVNRRELKNFQIEFSVSSESIDLFFIIASICVKPFKPLKINYIKKLIYPFKT
jgi:hypothetical protein